MSKQDKSAHGAPKDPPRTHFSCILEPFWTQFWIIFLTISATTRFSKICTAPTREHDFRGWNLPKNTHCGSLFPLNFRTFSRSPSGTPFLTPLMLHWSPKAGFWDPLWIPLAPKRLPKRSGITKKTCKIHFGVLRLSGDPLRDPFGIHLGQFWVPFGSIWYPFWDQFGTIRKQQNPMIRIGDERRINIYINI